VGRENQKRERGPGRVDAPTGTDGGMDTRGPSPAQEGRRRRLRVEGARRMRLPRPRRLTLSTQASPFSAYPLPCRQKPSEKPPGRGLASTTTVSPLISKHSRSDDAAVVWSMSSSAARLLWATLATGRHGRYHCLLACCFASLAAGHHRLDLRPCPAPFSAPLS